MGSGTSKDAQRQNKQAIKKILFKKKSQIKKEDIEDLQKASDLIGGEHIKLKQKFFKKKKWDPKDIKTQLVSEQKFDKYLTTKQSQKGYQFTDQQFPHKLNSLTLVSEEMPKAKQYQWIRIQDLYDGKKICLFQSNIKPSDIKQGNLGDCYFLSALSVLAERENLIQKIFINKNVNKEGIYGVILCIDGEFREVLVDDYIPSQDSVCVFSRNNEKEQEKYGSEVWVMLLEKVYAKCFGAYNQIVSGNCSDAIRDLTGAPAFIMSCSEEINKIWQFILEHVRLGYIVTARSKKQFNNSQKGNNEYENLSEYSYAILDAQDVYGNGKDRIIKIRDPWKNLKQDGDQSNNSQKTEELKSYQDFKNEDDGVLWIEINDFITQFSDVTANFVNDQYLYSSYKINMDTKNHMALIKFNVQNDDTHAFIQITQKDRRHFLKSDNYEYSLASVLICKGNFQEWVGCKISKERNITVEGDFQKGTYIAFVNIEWSENKCNADFFTISAYASSQIMFHQDSELFNDKSEIPVLDKMLICQPPENQEKVRRYDDDQDVIRYQGEAGGYLYFQFVNQSKQKSILYENIQLPSYQHLQIMHPFTNSSEFSIKLNPGEAKIIKYKTLPQGNGDYSYSVTYGGYLVLPNDLQKQKLIEIAKFNREEIEDFKVYLQQIQISEGYAFLYQNESKQTYIENVEFELNNLQVIHENDSIGQNKLQIKIDPGACYFFKLQIINTSKEYYYISTQDYKLK